MVAMPLASVELRDQLVIGLGGTRDMQSDQEQDFVAIMREEIALIENPSGNAGRSVVVSASREPDAQTEPQTPSSFPRKRESKITGTHVCGPGSPPSRG